MKKSIYYTLYKVATCLIILAIFASIMWLVGIFENIHNGGEINRLAIENIVNAVLVLIGLTLLLKYLVHIVCLILTSICVIKLWLACHGLKYVKSSDKQLYQLYKQSDRSYSRLFRTLFISSVHHIESNL